MGNIYSRNESARFDTIDTNLATVDTVVDNIRSVDVPAIQVNNLQDIDLDSAYVLSGDTLQANDAETSSGVGSYTKVKEIENPITGTLRVAYKVKSDTAGKWINSRIYLNGVAHGTSHYDASQDTYKNYSEDLAFTAGDLIQVYVQAETPNNVYVKEFRILGDLVSGFTNTLT